MKPMTQDELQEMLEDILPAGFQLETDDNGEIIILTNLVEDEEGYLVAVTENDDDSDYDDEERDDDFESYDESSPDD